jgi:hypothetical protein
MARRRDGEIFFSVGPKSLVALMAIGRIFSMDQRDYDKLKSKFEEDFRANMEALNRVFAAAKSMNGETKTTTAPDISHDESKEADDSASKGVILTAIRGILAKLSDRFTWRDVKDAAESEHPEIEFKDASVRQAVTRLVETEEVKIAEQGRGRRLTAYRRSK